MKLKELYAASIKFGIEADPRGMPLVESDMKRIKKSFDALPEGERAFFDMERLTNPYNDTRILFGDTEREIRSIIAGIDVDVGELLLCERLNQLGKKIDLVLSHHPAGRAYASFYEVMRMQADIFNKLGVSISAAEGLLAKRQGEVERRVMSANHMRVSDAAALLNIPLMCIHTPADNHVASYLQKVMDEEKPETLNDAIGLLRKIPEYKEASINNAGPRILVGAPARRAGKIFVDMTGGTEGPQEIFNRLSQAGVGTIVSMHLSEEHFKQVEKENINVIIAGHISSDTLGLNLIFDSIFGKEKIEVLSFSGYRRVKR